MMPEVIVKLLATLAILCGLLPMESLGLPAAAGTNAPSVACGDSSTARPLQAAGPLARTDLPEGAGDGEAMTEREMMACLIYQEAGGDEYSDECRVDVGDVALNRVEDSRFPGTLYEVMTAPYQYGTLWKTGIVWPERAGREEEAHAVERAYRIADQLLAGEHGPLYGAGYVFQAEFEQGSDGFWLDGMYFGR